MLARSIVTLTLQDLGVVASGETPGAADMALGFQKFSLMLDSLKAVRLAISELKRTTYATVAGTQSYTIGATGTWVAFRPQQIARAGFVNTNINPTDPQETEVDILTDEQWAAVMLKTMTATQVYALWYQTSVPNGIIYLYPIPSVVAQIALYVPTPLTSPATVDTDLDVPPGYQEMYIENLKLRMAMAFGKSVTQEMRTSAALALDIVLRGNIKAAKLALDPALTRRGRGYNILTNQ